MADIALVTAGRVHLVGPSVRQMSGVAAEAILAGAPCTLNNTGGVINADANGIAPINTVRAGIALESAQSGESVTCLQSGRLDGYNLDAQNHGTRIFVSDTVGALADATGTASLPVGNIEPAGAHPIASGKDKVLAVNIVTT